MIESIAELREEKQKLENDFFEYISRRIVYFRDKTGTEVSYINISFVSVGIVGQKPMRVVSQVNVDIDI